MYETNVYTCPICNEEKITITSERIGPPGYRTTDYDFGKTTCDCITYKCEGTAMEIKYSADGAEIKSDVCQECNEEKATVHYPVKTWIGEYKDICPTCFKKEMVALEEKYGK